MPALHGFLGDWAWIGKVGEDIARKFNWPHGKTQLSLTCSEFR